jgi:hypothetical protein
LPALARLRISGAIGEFYRLASVRDAHPGNFNPPSASNHALNAHF